MFDQHATRTLLSWFKNACSFAPLDSALPIGDGPGYFRKHKGCYQALFTFFEGTI